MSTSLPALIPRPRSCVVGEGILDVSAGITVRCDGDEAEDRFAAEHLAACLADEGGIACVESGIPVSIRRGPGPTEGYRIEVAVTGIILIGHDAAGVYYATQTLRQLLRGLADPGTLPILSITDAPAIPHRAAHYDTKHHQDRLAYVQAFIRELAAFKVNILVWEWEDKLAYRRYPELGAPGAFTIAEMQELTRYARRHHVEIVPLVQGLGHVPFILKHARFRHLREIPDSDWEFCPLNSGSYDLLFEIWTEAMEATPGSRFFHIGSDETYELGLGTACGCVDHARQHGKDSLMRLFIDRCTDWVEAQGRTCLSWGGQWKPGGAPPRPGMIWCDGDNPEVVAASAAAGYPCWIYAPNTGVTPLIDFQLPWVKCSRWGNGSGGAMAGGFARTSAAYRMAITAGTVQGSITTSWDDSGLHNQMFLPHFICGSAFSWNPDQGDLDPWIDDFYRCYFGPRGRDLRELQRLLQEGALFYDDTLQRRVWHWGDQGKLHLPDFPRAGLEYDTFWRKRYAALLRDAAIQSQALDRAASIIAANRAAGVRQDDDLEVMDTCVALMRHNVDLILGLGEVEALLKTASYDLHFVDRRGALACLRKMGEVLDRLIADKERVYADLVACWEKTRLPKGMACDGRNYFWRPERARHFANRTADLRYLVMDEDLLDLEGYRDRLRVYADHYEAIEIGA